VRRVSRKARLNVIRRFWSILLRRTRVATP
jgi:hypothetical protein